MKRQFEFFDILLRGTGPSLELLGAFALGLVVVEILGSLAYDLMTAPQGVLIVVWRPVTLALALTGVAYSLYRLDQKYRRSIGVSIDESRLAPSYAGLIWLLGPRIDHLLFALDHHQQDGGAMHCWLVMESNKEPILKAYERLSSQLLERGLQTQLHAVYIKRLDAQSAYQAVCTIFTQQVAGVGLNSKQVIADITGGTKPLTAGMILAVLTVGGALEYVESDRDERGDVILGTQRVVLVDTTFHLAPKEQE